MTDSLRVTVHPHGDQTPTAAMSGTKGDIPVLTITGASGMSVEVLLGNHPDPATWLHALVDAANELAWEIGRNAHDCPGVTGDDCATCEAAIAGGAA